MECVVFYVFVFLLILAIIVVILQYKQNKKYKTKIVTQEQVKKTVYSITNKMIKATSINEIYAIILDASIEVVPNASKGSVLALEEDGLFHYKSIYGYSPEILKLTLRKEEIWLGHINNFKETAIIKNPLSMDENIVHEKNVNELINNKALSINCAMCTPIYVDEKLIAILNIDCSDKTVTFNKEDVATINYIKNELELVIRLFLIQKQLKYMANYDELTGLCNRRLFKQLFLREIERIRRYNTEACLVLVDMDNFKIINDTYGHNTGDDALRFLSKIMNENIRKTDVLARMSGDEFVILFINCTADEADQKLKRIRNSLKNNKFNENLTLSFSFGVSHIDCNDCRTADEIFSEADKNMYLDKKDKGIR